jgi:hypothetical protein
LRIATSRCHNGADAMQFRKVDNPSKLTAAGIAAMHLWAGDSILPQF